MVDYTTHRMKKNRYCYLKVYVRDCHDLKYRALMVMVTEEKIQTLKCENFSK